jgi:hypothetical protein
MKIEKRKRKRAPLNLFLFLATSPPSRIISFSVLLSLIAAFNLSRQHLTEKSILKTFTFFLPYMLFAGRMLVWL